MLNSLSKSLSFFTSQKAGCVMKKFLILFVICHLIFVNWEGSSFKDYVAMCKSMAKFCDASEKEAIKFIVLEMVAQNREMRQKLEIGEMKGAPYLEEIIEDTVTGKIILSLAEAFEIEIPDEDFSGGDEVKSEERKVKSVLLVKRGVSKLDSWFETNRFKLFQAIRQSEAGYDVDLEPCGSPGVVGFVGHDEVEIIQYAD